MLGDRWEMYMLGGVTISDENLAQNSVGIISNSRDHGGMKRI